MIISASRRTDIPNYYSDWFYNRIRDGFVCVRNPMNPRQISRISLKPELVDCIVFWTKNPAAMMERLDELQSYRYYFQFTLTGYGKIAEPNLPDKNKVLIPLFQQLAKRLGERGVIWRYDPIFLSSQYTPEYHIKAFSEIAGRLRKVTKRAVISFGDLYAKNRKNMAELGMRQPKPEEILSMAAAMAGIAAQNGMEIVTCAEQIDLQGIGVGHGSCIDQKWIEQLIGCRLKASKDSGQRPECGCIESVEIGTYDTCLNGCRYCYANSSENRIREKLRLHDPNSPLLCGTVGPEDKVTERNVKSLKELQMDLFR